jgi:hypothetical protein
MADVMATRQTLKGQFDQLIKRLAGPASAFKRIQKNPLSATLCRLDVPFKATTAPVPREDAYMVGIQLRGMICRELWMDGKATRTEPISAGGVAFHDLRQNHVFLRTSSGNRH